MNRGRLGSFAAALLLLSSVVAHVSAAAATPQSTTLPNGVTIVSQQRPGGDVAAVDLAIRAGARYEDDGSDSAANFLERALLLGTDRWATRDELVRTISARGGRLEVTAGREIIELTTVVSLADLDLAFDVLTDIATRSRFETAALDAERRVVLQALASSEEDGQIVAANLLFDAVFDGHPLQRRPGGTRAGTERLTWTSLREFWGSRVVGPNVVVGVVSALDHDEIVRRVNDRLGTLPADGGSATNYRPVPDRDGARITATRGLGQAHVLIGAATPGSDSPDRAALRVLASALGGLSGPLFTEIRDRRGLAYVTNATLAQYVDGGLLYVYAGTQPSTVETVIELIQRELDRMREEPLFEAALQNAINGEIGRQAIANETSAAEAVSLARAIALGRPARGVEAAQLRAVTADDVRRVAAHYLRADRLTVVVVNPVERPIR